MVRRGGVAAHHQRMPGTELLGLLGEADMPAGQLLTDLGPPGGRPPPPPALGRRVARALSTTCSTSVIPPARCSTLALRDFILVPRPAASTTTVTSVVIYY